MGLAEIRRIHEQALLPKVKPKYFIPKISAKKAKQIKEQKQNGSDSEMDLFFAAMRKKMKGKCLFCGENTMKDNDEKFMFSIAHLLPKRDVDKGGFPSVGTNENNWVELCYYAPNSCHTNFDNGIITWEFIKDSKEWEKIKEQLLEILPLVAEEERKNKLYSKLINLVYDNK